MEPPLPVAPPEEPDELPPEPVPVPPVHFLHEA